MRAGTSLSALLAAGLCCLAQPVFAQSGDPRIAAATAARDAGRKDEAIAAFEALAAERPDDPNLLRLLGTSYAVAQRFEDAAAVLVRAQRLAPADQDIALARARVELWAGRPTRAREIAARIALAEPDNPELAALQAAIRNAGREERRIGVNLGFGLAGVELAGGNRTWAELSVAVDVRLGPDWTISADVEDSDREVAADTRLGLRVTRRFDGGSLYLAGATTPDADFRERWSLRAGGEIRLSRNVVATLDGRHADYGAANITALEPGIRLETRDGRYALALRSINLWDETGRHRSGWAGRVDGAPRDGLDLFAGAATYPDTEAGITRQIDAVFAGGRIRVAGNLSIGLTAEHERREQSYRRTGIAIGLRWTFGR